MPTLYVAANGRILEEVGTADETNLVLAPVTPPSAVASVFTFDGTTNPLAHAALRANLTAHRVAMVNGTPTLTRDGVAVPLAPDGAAQIATRNAKTLRTAVAANLAAVRAVRTQATALAAVTTAWTQPQRQGVAQAIATLADTQLALARLVANQLDDIA